MYNAHQLFAKSNKQDHEMVKLANGLAYTSGSDKEYTYFYNRDKNEP